MGIYAIKINIDGDELGRSTTIFFSYELELFSPNKVPNAKTKV